jgi:hypothetical protein
MLLFPCIDKSWVLYLVYFFTIICYNMYKSHSKYAKINSHIEVTTQIIYEHHGECPSDINKQSLKVPGEWLLDKNIHSVLSNVLFNLHIQGGQRTSCIRVFFYRKLYNGGIC